MSRKRAIKRMLLTFMWVGVAIGMFIIVSAAIRVQDNSQCAGYEVHITGAKDGSLFTSKDQIVKLLKTATGGEIKGQIKSGFNLPRIEDLLEQSSWVYNAGLYFDNQDVLHVVVTERKPLARVFAQDGASFYIDEAGKQIPLSEKISLDVPVFTGYPAKKVLNAADSVLLENMIAAASFINSDSFWVSQVSQIDIHKCGTDCWNMEMIPVIGNHRVDLGDGSDIASKFHRLYLFYDQVLKRTGFDKYQKVDVQYNGQVIGVRGNYTKVDSLQLRKNIEELLLQSRKTNDLLEVAHAVPGTRMMELDSTMDQQPVFSTALDSGEPIDTLARHAAETPVLAKPVHSEDSKEKSKPIEKQEVDKKEPVKKAPIKKEPVAKPASKENRSLKTEPVKKATVPKKEAKPVVKKNEAPVVKKPVAKKTTVLKAKTTQKPQAKPKEIEKKKTTPKKTNH